MPAVVPSEKLPISQARALDSRAWDQLFRRYQLPLYTFIFDLIREEQPTLDIVQETFILKLRLKWPQKSTKIAKRKASGVKVNEELLTQRVNDEAERFLSELILSAFFAFFRG